MWVTVSKPQGGSHRIFITKLRDCIRGPYASRICGSVRGAPRQCMLAGRPTRLADGVLSSVSSCTTFLFTLLTVKMLVCHGLCVGKKIKIPKGGKKKMNFFMGQAGTLFCKLWSVLGLVAVCKCVWLLHRLLVFPNNTQNSFISPCRNAVFVKNWILIVVFV